MSAVEQKRPTVPLVFALPLAIAQAHRLGLDGVLENHVFAGILSGKKRRQPPAGLLPRCSADERVVFIGENGQLVARLKRTTSPLVARNAWRVTSVQVAPNARTRRENPWPTS